jgi:hypothetical protein
MRRFEMLSRDILDSTYVKEYLSRVGRCEYLDILHELVTFRSSFLPSPLTRVALHKYYNVFHIKLAEIKE